MVSSQSKMKTKIREMGTMLMSFSEVIGLSILLAVDVKFGEVPVSDLIWCPRSKDDNIIVVIFVRLLLL